MDGLDERQGDDQQRAIPSFVSSVIRDRPLSLRFLIASRPEPHIRHLFSLRKGDVCLTLQRIHSLLLVPKEKTEVIHVYHKPLAYFMFDSNRTGEHHLDLDFYHLDVVCCCLRLPTSPSGSS